MNKEVDGRKDNERKVNENRNDRNMKLILTLSLFAHCILNLTLFTHLIALAICALSFVLCTFNILFHFLQFKRAIFPAGTVSGAPKVRAMELVADLEPERRHVYAGAVGYVSFTGELDTAIAIRTIMVYDGHVYVQAGGGITYDSKETPEYFETINKLKATMRAIDRAGECGGNGDGGVSTMEDNGRAHKKARV